MSGGFLGELRRRNVIRMAGLYLVGAWLIIQVSATLLPVFEAPAWVMKVVVGVLATGYLPALAFSWAFELTPDGLKRDGVVDPADSIAPQTGRTMDRLIIAGLALVIMVMAVERFWLSRPAAPAAVEMAAGKSEEMAIRSVAVLPFQNKEKDADVEYLCDGLTESLIFRLADLPKLKVSPSSSISRYKGKLVEPKEAGAELGVGAVVTGHVAQHGDDLSISVEMVDVASNTLIWGNQYNRKMSDLLATQREIALAIGTELKLDLSGRGSAGLTKRYTNSNEAYRLYLQGRYHVAKRTRDDINQGIDYFRRATRLDPAFAIAFANMAEAYTIMPSHAYLPPKAAIPQAKAAAQQALALDPALADSHMVMANILAGYEWKWPEAEREFKTSFELNPNVSTAHLRYSQYLSGLGRLKESLEESNRALELEPLSLNISANLALVHLYSGHNQQGLDLAKSTHALDPAYANGRLVLGIAYNSTGLYEGAIRLSEGVLASEPTNQHMLMAAGVGYAKSGRRRDAETIIGRFREMAKTQYVIAYWIATIYAALGDKDQAFAELERSLEQRDWWLTRLKVDPLMDSLRDDPRFGVMLRKVGLPE